MRKSLNSQLSALMRVAHSAAPIAPMIPTEADIAAARDAFYSARFAALDATTALNCALNERYDAGRYWERFDEAIPSQEAHKLNAAVRIAQDEADDTNDALVKARDTYYQILEAAGQ